MVRYGLFLYWRYSSLTLLNHLEVFSINLALNLGHLRDTILSRFKSLHTSSIEGNKGNRRENPHNGKDKEQRADAQKCNQPAFES